MDATDRIPSSDDEVSESNFKMVHDKNDNNNNNNNLNPSNSNIIHNVNNIADIERGDIEVQSDEGTNSTPCSQELAGGPLHRRHHRRGHANTDKERIAPEEDRAVFWTEVLVVSLLVLTTIAASTIFYLTTSTLLYSMIGLVVGIIIMLAFAMFDWRVRRRHVIVTSEALKARQIVGSLFPSTVHDRLFRSSSLTNCDVLASATETNGVVEQNDIIASTTEQCPSVIDKIHDSETSQNIGCVPEEEQEVKLQQHPTIIKGIASGFNSSSSGMSMSDFGMDEPSEYEEIKLGDDDSCSNDDLEKNRQAYNMSMRSMRFERPPIQRLRSFLGGDLLTASSSRTKSLEQNSNHSGKSFASSINDDPIADLFTDCTVSFADISGFTAWSRYVCC
jgi:hypothetical protein